MSTGILTNAPDSVNVDMGVTSNVAPVFFTRDSAYNLIARLAGTEITTGDAFVANAAVGVEIKAGVLTMGTVSATLPLFAPAFPLASVTLYADPAYNDRIFVRVVGDVSYAGKVVDLDVNWSIWEEGY